MVKSEAMGGFARSLARYRNQPNRRRAACYQDFVGGYPDLSCHFALRHTCKTSPSLATAQYSTGLTKNPSNNLETKPATITMAKGFCVSDPMPVESAAGSNPRHATNAVIMIGRNRSNDASYVASRIPMPSSRSLLI